MTTYQREQTSNPTSDNDSEWTGYQTNVPLDEIVDCDKCPPCCQRCYYRNKARPKWQKALVIFIYLALIDVMIALITRYGTLGDIHFYIGDADQRVILRTSTDDDTSTSNFSPFFCSSYKLSVNDRAAYVNGTKPSYNAFILGVNPRREDEPTTLDLEYYPQFKAPHDEFTRYHYTSHDDFINIAACAPNRSLHLFLIKGESHYKKWSEHFCCYYSQSYLIYPCDEDGNPTTFLKLAGNLGNPYGEIYFVFTPNEGVGFPYYANISFQMERKLYDVKGALASCVNDKSCTFNVERQTSTAVVVDYSNFEQYESDQVGISATCHPSFGVYFAIFAGIPLGILFCVAAIGFILCRCQQSVNSLAEQGDRRRAMANLNLFSNHRSTRQNRQNNMEPESFTSYSSLVNNEASIATDVPPSYSAVVSTPISNRATNEDDSLPPPSYNTVYQNWNQNSEHHTRDSPI